MIAPSKLSQRLQGGRRPLNLNWLMARKGERMKKKQFKKINHRQPDWMNIFDREFKQVYGILSIVSAGLVYEIPVAPEVTGDILDGLLMNLDRLNDAVQGAWRSIEDENERERIKKAA